MFLKYLYRLMTPGRLYKKHNESPIVWAGNACQDLKRWCCGAGGKEQAKCQSVLACTCCSEWWQMVVGMVDMATKE